MQVLKKKRVWVTAIALVVASVSVFFIVSACNSDPLRGVMRHVSEIQHTVWTGSNSEYHINIVTGKRENPYQLDGSSTSSKTNFTVVTLTPSTGTQTAPTQTFAYTLTAGSKNYSGTFVANPFGNSYFADLNQLLNANDTVAVRVTTQAVTASSGAEHTSGTADVTFDITLTTQNLPSYIKAEEALTIAYNEFLSLFENDINFEILIKFVTDPLKATNNYFWYVALVDKDNNYNALLINPSTSEIIAKKVSS